MPIGHDFLFKDYSLKVLTLIRSYGKFDRTEAPTDIDTFKQ